MAVIAASMAGCGPEGLPETDTTLRGAGAFAEVTGFGSNPGGLKMYAYVPQPPPSGAAPLVLALHACSQTASAYQNAGWNALADRYGFYVLYPEQQTNNNALRCFNWAGEYGDPTNLMRGEGENQSIIQMIDKMKADHQIDDRRIFIMGHSGGAAQASLMLATWPEVFAAGAMIAGIPYNCTTTFTEVSTCLNPGIDRTPQQWGDRARAGDSGYSGPWPRVSVWHGAADSTVNPINSREIIEQWTNVHGIDQMEDASGTVDGATHREYQDAGGVTRVEYYEVPGMNHGTPVDPASGCGTAGAYFLSAGICAVSHMADFFGISGAAPGDRTPPTVNITAPATGMNVSGTVQIRIDAADDTGVDHVDLLIDGTAAATLRSAPYQHAWSTSGVTNGAHRLRAVAYDAAGNSAADDDTTVQVTGGVNDTTPPTVNLTAPAGGAMVSGTVSITAQADDDLGVARVDFAVDGTTIGSATQSPYTVSWDSGSVAAGSHRLSATAFDTAGNQASDDDTSVTTSGMTADTTAPTVSIADPAEGATISGVFTVRLQASDNVGVKTALLFLGDDLIGSDYREPFEFLWDTTTFPTGQQMLTARVFDAAGNLGLAMSTVTIERGGEQPPPEETEQLYYGRKHWGCTAAPCPSDQLGLALVLGAGWLLARRSLGRRARGGV